MILYLSDTGNTGWAAKTIAEATGDRLLFIPELTRSRQYDFTLAEGERLGICFPVHGWRPPMIVREFVKHLNVNAKGHYVYALCTAGDNIGETMDLLRHDLEARGVELNAAFSLIMPESYLGLPFFNSRLLGGFFTKYLVSDKKFKVDTDRCIKCGICASVCPTKNVIGGKDAEPQWKHDGSCLACFACYHHCPRHAIDYGSLTKRKGQYFFGRKNG